MDQAESAQRLRKQLKSKKQEYKRIRTEEKKDDKAEISEHKRKIKTIQQEILQLEHNIRAAKKGQVEDESPVTTGALPDFLVIGGKKCGTSFLYHLLTLHPLVEPAATKELHFFNAHFDLGVEWYRQCFPAPRWEDGRRTITGEATPYIAHRRAPQRVAQVVPQVRLIALLRNPVERAYSDYQMRVRKEREHETFEEALRVAHKGRSRVKGGGVAPQREDHVSVLNDDSSYLRRSVYVDQLERWSELLPREQMLVLKSEDFFERPQETLNTVFEFLDLPQWEPEASEIIPKKRKKGSYEELMDPATRRRLEEYFEPHNRRLYEFLGEDFGW